MPGAINIFALWFAPSIAMLLGAIIGIVIYKQGIKRAGRTAFNGFRRLFFKESYRNYQRNLLRQYDKELSTNRLLGKHFSKGYQRIRPNFLQRMLQKMHIYRYEPKELSIKQQEWRKNKIHRIKAYLKDVESVSEATYSDTHPRQQERKKEAVEREYPQHYTSRKEYLKSPRISSIAADESTLSTSSEEATKKFKKFVSDPTFKERAADLSGKRLYHRIYVTSSDGKDLPLESFVTKDKEAFYSIGSDLLKHMTNNVPQEVYPVKIAQTIVKDGKEVREERLYKKADLVHLMRRYESELKTGKTTETEYEI